MHPGAAGFVKTKRQSGKLSALQVVFLVRRAAYVTHTSYHSFLGIFAQIVK